LREHVVTLALYPDVRVSSRPARQCSASCASGKSIETGDPRQFTTFDEAREAGEQLAEENSPAVGAAVQGPTAVILPAGKIDNADMNMGASMNLRLEPSALRSHGGVKRLADLIRVFVDEKVDQVQINVVSSETLRTAQREPENYQDLCVKVAGYNARFVELQKEMQDTIIARTEHGI
jgi:pyruvate-formate lyase